MSGRKIAVSSNRKTYLTLFRICIQIHDKITGLAIKRRTKSLQSPVSNTASVTLFEIPERGITYPSFTR